METLPALQNTQVEVLISQAIDKNVPVETMERILAMRKELKMEYAKEQFDIALSNFQGACPVIVKTKAVYTSTGKLAYKYAPIESIVSQVRDLLREYGFSYTIKTETTTDFVEAICVVKHSAGYTEQSSFKVPLGNKTALMSDTQLVAAALTFAKRYAFCNAFGILTGDEDTDSVNKSESKSVDQVDIDLLKELLTSAEIPLETVYKKYNVSKLEDLSSDNLHKAIRVVYTYMKRDK